MLGEYIEEQVPVLIYGGNFIACWISRYILWSYATGNYRLVDEDIDPREVRIPKIMLIIGMVVFMIGMGISFLNTIASVCIFALLLASFIVSSAVNYRVSTFRESAR